MRLARNVFGVFSLICIVHSFVHVGMSLYDNMIIHTSVCTSVALWLQVHDSCMNYLMCTEAESESGSQQEVVYPSASSSQ